MPGDEGVLGGVLGGLFSGVEDIFAGRLCLRGALSGQQRSLRTCG